MCTIFFSFCSFCFFLPPFSCLVIFIARRRLLELHAPWKPAGQLPASVSSTGCWNLPHTHNIGWVGSLPVFTYCTGGQPQPQLGTSTPTSPLRCAASKLPPAMEVRRGESPDTWMHDAGAPALLALRRSSRSGTEKGSKAALGSI